MSILDNYNKRTEQQNIWTLLTNESLVITVLLVILGFLVVLPVGMLLFGSIWSGAPGEPGWFTAQYYLDVYQSPGFLTTLLNTIMFGFGSTLVALFFSITLAYILQRTNTPFRGWLSLIVVLPLVLNPLITAIAFVAMFAPKSGTYNGIIRDLVGVGGPGPVNIFTMSGAVVVTGFVVTPIMYIYTMSAFENLNRLHEEAAIMSGAGVYHRMRDIVLPITFPALASGFILTLAFVFGLFSIPVILLSTGGTDVITTFVFYELFDYPANYGVATAAALGLVVISLALVFLQKHYQKEASEYATVTGKGFTKRVRDIGWRRWPALGYVLTYIFVSTVLPLSMLVLLSLRGVMKADIRPQAWSLSVWVNLFTSAPNTWKSIFNSIVLAAATATLVIAFMVAVSWLSRKHEGTWIESVIQYSTILSIAVPGIVLGISFVWIWSSVSSILGLSIYGTLWVMLFAYMTRWIPFGYRASETALIQIDPLLLEAATISGAGWFKRIRTIMLPLAKTGLVAGWQLVFIFSFLELSASILLFTADTMVVSVHIFQLWNTGRFGLAAAVSILTVVLVFVVLVGTSLLTGVSVKRITEAY